VEPIAIKVWLVIQRKSTSKASSKCIGVQLYGVGWFNYILVS
jgi:hypothetical protein